MTSPQTLRDASTVILVRESQDAPSHWQVLMVKRSAKSSFMPDVYVYPGGALDPADCTHNLTSVLEPGWGADEAHLRLREPQLSPQQALGLYLAAIREVFEESGLLIAWDRATGQLVDLLSSKEKTQAFSKYRAELVQYSISMHDLLESEDLFLKPSQLGYFARWITPLHLESRRYDARFFVIKAPLNQRALPDFSEVVDSRWARPATFLDDYAQGKIELAPPTISSLKRLAAFSSVDELFASACQCAPLPMLPHAVKRDGALELLLPHHPDYPSQLRESELLPRWDSEHNLDTPAWNAFSRTTDGRWVTC